MNTTIAQDYASASSAATKTGFAFCLITSLGVLFSICTFTVSTDGKVAVKAIAFDPSSGKSSPVSYEKFDIVRKTWKVMGIDDQQVENIIDGDQNSAWHQGKDRKMPIDIVIDLGKEAHLSGFKYLPDQGRNNGIITNYQFFVSQDNAQWKLADEGEFSNIRNMTN